MAVLLVRLVDETGAFLAPGTLESFRADLGLSYAQAGAVLAAGAPGALLGSAFSVAADRHSRRAIAAGGAFGVALSQALFAAGASFWALVAASFVLGVGSTAMVDACDVALVDLAGDDLRSYLARSNLLGTIGDLAGPVLIAGVAAAGWSWRVVFWVGAALTALYGLLLATSSLPAPAALANGRTGADGSHDDKEPDGWLASLLSVASDPAVWVIGLVLLLMAPFDEPLVGFTIALLEQERGASAALATVVAGVGVSGGLLAFTVLARRFEGADDQRLLMGSVVAATVGAIVIAAVPSVAVAAAGALVVSTALSLGWLAVQHRSLVVRPGQAGTTNAVLSTINLLGFWLPAAIGAVADGAGLATAVGTFGLLGLALIGLTLAGRRALTNQRAAG